MQVVPLHELGAVLLPAETRVRLDDVTGLDATQAAAAQARGALQGEWAHGSRVERRDETLHVCMRRAPTVL